VTVLAYNPTIDGGIYYGNIGNFLGNAGNYQWSIQNAINADIAPYLPSGTSGFMASCSLYAEFLLSDPPTLFESAFPKYKLGQYNLSLGGYEVCEGFLNYTRQLLAVFRCPLAFETFPYYTGTTTYSQQPGSAEYGILLLQPEQATYVGPFEGNADNVGVNFTANGEIVLLLSYFTTTYTPQSEYPYVVVL